MDVYAPAHDLRSASLRSASSYRELYGAGSGTSFSAAIVSGVVAQYLEKRPWYDPASIWNSLNSRSVVLSNVGDPDFIGSFPFVQLPDCGPPAGGAQ